MACRMRRTVVCVEQVTGAAAARGPGFCGWRSRQAKGSGAVRDCRRAYLDLERASGRLALVGRLAALLARTPADLLPIGLLLVPGPERAAVRRGGSRPGRDADGPRGRHRYRRRAPRADAGRDPPVGEPGGHGRAGHAAPDRRVRGRIRRVASWTCWPAAVSPCRKDDRCAFIRLGDTVARFTVK